MLARSLPATFVAALLLAHTACQGVPAGSRQPLATPSPAEERFTAAPAPPTPSPSEPTVTVGPGEPWLVYQAHGAGGRTTIQLVRPDGTGDHPLFAGSAPGDEQAHPAWSPDGAWIAFDAWFRQPSGPDRIEVWVARVDGSEPRAVASCTAPCLQLAYPAWSPDGTALAVARYDIRGNGEWGRAAIEVVDVASGTRTIVAETADGRSAYYVPRWSPDGRSLVLAVETYADERQVSPLSSSLATVSVGGTPATPVLITPAGMYAHEPDWAPSQRIAFAVADSAETWGSTVSLAAIDPDGSDLLMLTDATAGDATAWEPVWAEAGRSILFSTLVGAAQRTATIPGDGGTPTVASWSLRVPRGDPRRVHVHPRPVASDS